VSNSEMSSFCFDQGRTRVCGEAYVCTPQPETRGERRAGQKGPFMDGHNLKYATQLMRQRITADILELQYDPLEIMTA
jgi:hypothetical protein